MVKYFKLSIIVLSFFFNKDVFGLTLPINGTFQSNKIQKVISYFPSGEVSSISYYKKGYLIKYIDYFQNGAIFQHINYKNELYHGKYMMWNEDLNMLLKGKMKNGKPYSGNFEKYLRESGKYEIQIYKKGQIK